MRKMMISRLMSLGVVALGFVVLSVVPVSSALAADLKVLVVNQTAVLQGSLAGRDQAAKLQTIFAAIEADERAELEVLGKELQELLGQKALLGEGYSRKQMELQQKAEIVKYRYEQERKFSQEGSQRLIVQRVYPIFNELMKERKGTLLLDQSQVIMTSPDFNITEEVVKRLDAALPTVEVRRVTFAEIQKAFEEQQAKAKAAQEARK